MNKIAISLNNNIQCEYICNKIQQLINKLQSLSQNLNNSLLVIEIIHPTLDDSHIPKIEYKDQ